MDRLQRELDELLGRRRPRQTPTAVCAPAPAAVADVLGGTEYAVPGSACWVVETRFEAVQPDHGVRAAHLCGPLCHHVSARTRVEIAPPRALVVDIETGGLAGAPVFLIGVVDLAVWPLRVTQFLARDYPEEAAILFAFAGLTAVRDTWVTFNGKSFDGPFLRDRMLLHRLRALEPAVHFDLLHAARRRWRRDLPDCRLETLEREILGRQRIGDIPGCDIPDLFHHFMHTGNAAPLRPVLEHNRLDLVASTELLLKLADPLQTGA